jgi:16S rRNA (uracil1498-N3)-methyltransferase
MKRTWRVHLPDLPAEAGAVVDLPGEESHYVRRVLRLGPGEQLALFDGRGGEWAAEVIDSAGAVVRVVLTEEVVDPVEPLLEVEIFQGMCRADRMELVIQKATELGVMAIHALSAERADLPRPNARRIQRWHRIAVEACRQSGRRLVPRISPADELPPPPGSDVLAILLHPAAEARPIADLLDSAVRRAVWLAIGPESGFSREEIDRATSTGWRLAGLGPRILRTESAGLAAAAVVLSRWGDLGSRSG